MATDYKRRAEPQRAHKGTPCWVWFTAGLMLGVFGCGLAWLKLVPQGSAQLQPLPGFQPQVQAPAKAPSAPKPVAKPAPKAEPPRFDFYTILPETEVVVPKERPRPAPPTAAAPSPPGQSAGAPASSRESYVLQAGAFSRREDADRLRATLALLGVEADIQSVKINDRGTVYRVRSGPYRSRDALDQVRANLQRNGINSIGIKLEG